jgi:hypothetical protein
MKNLVIITSVIEISKNPLNYTKTRSVYTPEERFEQTLKTIESCSKIKDKEIVLVETSNIGKDKEEEIKKNVDYYYNFYKDEEIKKLIDSSYKSIAEGTQLWELLKKIDLKKYDNIIKISGRYWFSDDFHFENYNNQENVFKEGPNQTALATVMFKVNKKDFGTLKETIDYSRKSNGMFEKNFVKFFKNRYITYPKIGVEGYVSVDGNFISW